MNSITRRWVRGSLLITVLVLVFAEAMFLYFSISGYYDGAARALAARADTLITQLSVTDAASPEAREGVLRRMVEQFDEKDRFELMLIDTSGRVAVSTAGFASSGTAAAQDLVRALADDEGVGRAVYTTEGGERVMALTAVLPFACGEVLAVRVVTSLALLNEALLRMGLVSAALMAAVLGFSIWSGVFFIRSIVRPIGVIEGTAARIARGNFDIRIDNKYDDEVGQLANTINRMAGELGKTERMKNEFISSVSHELRTPLTSIKGWVETIAHARGPSDPVYRRGVQVIASETDRLYEMVEELLDFSRIQNGLQLKCEKLDLAAEVTDTVIMMGQRAQLEGVRLVWDEPEQPVPVYADAGRLRQVFVNLLDNALKYSKEGGRVTVELLSDGRSAYVNVADEGPGIAPEDLENVKVKFYKAKGAVRGSGIGLAVADEIARAHGGSLSLQSELGKGTTATVRLPLDEGREGAAERNEQTDDKTQ